ncbi:uncharacterized protein V1518DRAFT_410750 [Limtongia smithiae]|uniref:uncharacterized protein n=1 Tax=Limtongia smithiae TaxID=1125753 RepID=UPI0034CEE5F3
MNHQRSSTVNSLQSMDDASQLQCDSSRDGGYDQYGSIRRNRVSGRNAPPIHRSWHDTKCNNASQEYQANSSFGGNNSYRKQSYTRRKDFGRFNTVQHKMYARHDSFGSQKDGDLFGDSADVIYVGHLSANTTDSDLYRLFSPYGNIVDLSRRRSMPPGSSPMYPNIYAFIRYTDPESAYAAISELDGTFLGGKRIAVRTRQFGLAANSIHSDPYHNPRPTVQQMFARQQNQSPQIGGDPSPRQMSVQDTTIVSEQASETTTQNEDHSYENNSVLQTVVVLSNLPFEVTPEGLYKIMSEYANVFSVLIHDQPDENGKRYADAVICTMAGARQVCEIFHGEDMQGHLLDVRIKAQIPAQYVPMIYWPHESAGGVLPPFAVGPQRYGMISSMPMIPMQQYDMPTYPLLWNAATGSYVSYQGPPPAMPQTYDPSFFAGDQPGYGSLPPVTSVPLDVQQQMLMAELRDANSSRSEALQHLVQNDVRQVIEQFPMNNEQFALNEQYSVNEAPTLEEFVAPVLSRMRSNTVDVDSDGRPIVTTPFSYSYGKSSPITRSRSALLENGDELRNLYIKNLDERYITSTDDLRALFEEYGEIESVNLITYPNSSLSRGFGFVLYRFADSAAKARTSLDGKMIGTKRIHVSHAEQREGRHLRFAKDAAHRARIPRITAMPPVCLSGKFDALVSTAEAQMELSEKKFIDSTPIKESSKKSSKHRKAEAARIEAEQSVITTAIKEESALMEFNVNKEHREVVSKEVSKEINSCKDEVEALMIADVQEPDQAMDNNESVEISPLPTEEEPKTECGNESRLAASASNCTFLSLLEGTDSEKQETEEAVPVLAAEVHAAEESSLVSEKSFVIHEIENTTDENLEAIMASISQISLADTASDMASDVADAVGIISKISLVVTAANET